MAEAVKEIGNRYCKQGRHLLALDRYSLAYTLDPSNIYALCNRARIHLLVCILRQEVLFDDCQSPKVHHLPFCLRLMAPAC